MRVLAQVETSDELATKFVDNDGAAKELTPEEAFDDRDILDGPMSWCQPFTVDRQMFR
jgi:hypothetical protein